MKKELTFGETVFIAVVVLVLATLLSCVNGGILYGLWNWMVVPAFSVPPVTYWQAFVVAVVLSSVGAILRGVSATSK